MKLPYRTHLRRTSRVIEVLECHAQDLGRQSLRKFSTVLRIEPESVLCELRLRRLPRTAELAVNRRFDDYTRRLLVRCLRNFKMHVAVGSVDTRLLQEGGGDVKNAELAAGPRCIGRDKSVLRPAQNRVDADFFSGNIGDRHVLGDVAKIGDVRLNWQTLAQILRRGLQDSVVAPLAGTGGEP